MFHAQTFEGIKHEDCPITGFLFDSDCETLRYGLFRVLTYQIRRMQAATAPVVTLDGYVRRFRWQSGLAFWANAFGEHIVHPNGYIRMFNEDGAWYWAFPDGTPVLGRDGHYLWDTGSLGL